jgi:uncharacterized protein involved in exopolysaccharide biosynthesis
MRVQTEVVREPEGITRRVVLNLLEAFFRRPWLFVLPIVLLLGVGLASAAEPPERFRSSGAINATTAEALTEFTDSAATPAFTWETPAAITARRLNEFLGTRQFLLSIAAAADIPTDEANEDVILSIIGGSVFAAASGDNLVRVGAETDNPEAAQNLASATIDAFRNKMVELEVSGTQTAERILQEQIIDADAAVTTAREALISSVGDMTAAEQADLPLRDQLQFEQLQSDLVAANTRLTELEGQLAAAELRTGDATTVIEQRYDIVDEPNLPRASEPRFQQAVFTMALFATLGIIVSAALLVLAAALDRTVRVPNDITARTGIDVLAVVPKIGR